MDLDELVDAVQAMFYGTPETIGVQDMLETLRAVCETDAEVPSLAEVRDACETLVARNVLQRAGRTGYEAVIHVMTGRSGTSP